MANWFSTYNGTAWTPQHGFNTLFATQVRMIRQQFSLERGGPGLDIGTGVQVPYNFGPHKCYRDHSKGAKPLPCTIEVTRFEWGKVINSGGLTPQFRLQIMLRRGGRVVLDKPLVIEFPTGFPQQQPRFKIDDRRYYTIVGLLEHHILYAGWFCIMQGSNAWKPDTDTIISGLNCALEMIVWHQDTWGW